MAGYTRIEGAAISPVVADVASCEGLHLSQNVHHISALEVDHKLNCPYPHAQLSDIRHNISLMDS